MKPLVPIALLLAADASAAPVTLEEQPHHTTQATVTVDASPLEVYALVTDYARWPSLFSDDRSVKLESGTRENAKVRFRSNILEHEVTVQFDNIPDRQIRFKGIKGPPGGRASGTYTLEPVDAGRKTRINASFYLEVVGVPGAFVSDPKLRKMRESKLRTDLTDLSTALSHRHEQHPAQPSS